MVKAAAKAGIPTAVHESNAVPGLTTEMLEPFADRIMVGFEACRQYYKHPERVCVTGTPVRGDFFALTKAEARKRLGMEDDRPLIVSFWGSLGAAGMNRQMADFLALEAAKEPFHHIHATGSFGWEWMPGLVKEKGVDLEHTPSIDMREYIFNMPTVMAAADVIISRAGAATCNEIGASATPSILIPSPNVTANHQEKNARVLYDHGVTVLILEKDCTPEVMYKEIRGLLADEARREAISAKLRKLVRHDSTERICDIVEELAHK